MDEPCKKKPRKSKLVPCTYVELPEPVPQDAPPSKLQFKVNVEVEVEECEDWMDRLVEEDRLTNPNPKRVKYMRQSPPKSLLSKKSAGTRCSEPAQSGSKDDAGTSKSTKASILTHKSSNKSQDDKDISKKDKEISSRIDDDDESTWDATETIELENTKIVLENGMPMFIIDKAKIADSIANVDDKKEVSVSQGKGKKSMTKKEKRMQPLYRVIQVSEKMPALPSALLQPETHYLAIDRTVLIADKSGLAPSYRALVKDAIQVSPYKFPSHPEVLSRYCCTACDFKTTVLNSFEIHLVVRHSLGQQYYIVVEPDCVSAVEDLPVGEMAVTKLESGHIAYYCVSYEDAVRALYTKWHLTAANSPYRKREILCFKCYPCWMYFNHCSEFLAHLQSSHAAAPLALAAELASAGCGTIVAGLGHDESSTDVTIYKTEKAYVCNKCNNEIATSALLSFHLNSSFTCDGCGRVFSCNEIVQHYGFCSKFLEKYYPKACPCRSSFNSARELADHQLSCLYKNATLAFNCVVCSYTVPTSYMLAKHQITTHVPRSDLFVDGVKLLKCNLCRNKFVGPLDLHTCPKRSDGIDCKHCGLRFQSHMLLTVHLKAQKNRECNVCGNRFSVSCQLDMHKVIKHNSIHKIVYQCTLCKMCFDYERHMDIMKKYALHECTSTSCTSLVKEKENLRKMLVYKHMGSSWAYEDNKELDIESKDALLPALPVTSVTENKEGVASTSNIVSEKKTAKTSQLKVYSGNMPKMYINQSFINKITIGPSKNPEVHPIYIRGLYSEKSNAVDNSRKTTKDFVVQSNRSLLKRKVDTKNNGSRSLLKKIVDKIVYEDDDEEIMKVIPEVVKKVNAAKVDENRVDDHKIDENKVKVKIEESIDFTETSVEGKDDLAAFNDNGMKVVCEKLYENKSQLNQSSIINEINLENKNYNKVSVKNDNKVTSEKQKDWIIESKPVETKTCIKVATKKQETNPKSETESLPSTSQIVDAGIENLNIRNTDNATIKTYRAPKTPNFTMDSDICDVVKTEKVTPEDIASEELTTIKSETSNKKLEFTVEPEFNVVVKQEIIETTDDVIEYDPGKDIKEEVCELITNLKTENPNFGPGCSYATEVSVDKVISGSDLLDEVYFKKDVKNIENENKAQKKAKKKDEKANKSRKIYKCQGCNFTGVHKLYIAHKKKCCPYTSKPVLTYKCLRCDLQCFDLRDYLKHLIRHGYQKFQCPACQGIQAGNQKLAEHVLQHIKSNFRKITYIDKSKTDQTKKFRCNNCRSILCQTEFFLHWQTHFDQPPEREVEIDLIDDSDPNKMTQKEINSMLTFIQVSKRLKDRMCFKCNHEFARLNDLKRHFIEHLLAHAYSQKKRLRELRCQLCNDGFSKPEFYKKHMRDHALLPLYQCQICDKAFSDSSNFGKHKKVHNLFVFVCDICSKKFQCKMMLEKHLQAHQTTEPQQCQHCGKKFFFQTALRRHEKTKHSFQTFCCRVCRQRFPSCKEKWIHEWEVHKERKFDGDCPICNKSFRNFSDTKNHLKSEHGIDCIVGNMHISMENGKNNIRRVENN